MEHGARASRLAFVRDLVVCKGLVLLLPALQRVEGGAADGVVDKEHAATNLPALDEPVPRLRPAVAIAVVHAVQRIVDLARAHLLRDGHRGAAGAALDLRRLKAAKEVLKLLALP